MCTVNFSFVGRGLRYCHVAIIQQIKSPYTYHDPVVHRCIRVYKRSSADPCNSTTGEVEKYPEYVIHIEIVFNSHKK